MLASMFGRFCILPVLLCLSAGPGEAQQQRDPAVAAKSQEADPVTLLPSCFGVAERFPGNTKETPGEFTLQFRMKGSASCTTPAHWNTARQMLMWQSGTLRIEPKDEKPQELSARGFVVVPSRMVHKLVCLKDCEFFMYLDGRFDIHYVDKEGKEIPARLAIAGAVPVPVDQKPKRVRPAAAVEHFAQGLELRKQGRLDWAIEEYKKAIAIDPDYSDAHYNLGNTYHLKAALGNGVDPRGLDRQIPTQGYRQTWRSSLQELDLAIGEFKEVLRLQPNSADAHFKLGLVYDNKGDTRSALQEYREAIRLDPQGPDGLDARNNIALISYFVDGNSEEAIRGLEAVLAINPSHPAKENIKIVRGLGRRGTITVYVNELERGEVAGVRVSAVGSGREYSGSMTGTLLPLKIDPATGRVAPDHTVPPKGFIFTIENVPAGAAEVRVSLNSVSLPAQTADVKADGSVSVTFTIDAKAVITGVVTDNGKPLKGWIVVFAPLGVQSHGASGGVQTSERGRYEVRLRPGAYEIQLAVPTIVQVGGKRVEGWSPKFKTIHTVTRTGTLDLEVTMLPRTNPE